MLQAVFQSVNYTNNGIPGVTCDALLSGDFPTPFSPVEIRTQTGYTFNGVLGGINFPDKRNTTFGSVVVILDPEELCSDGDISVGDVMIA